MSELQTALVEATRNKPEKAEADDPAFGLAKEITLAYAGSSGANSTNIPYLFVELYRLFRQGTTKDGKAVT